MKKMKILTLTLVFSTLILMNGTMFAQNIFPETGNVGVGTITPTTALNVKSNAGIVARFEPVYLKNRSAGIKIKGARNGCTTCDIAYIDLGNYDSNQSGGTEYNLARISGGMAKNNTPEGYLSFQVGQIGGLEEVMRINHLGQAKIGNVTTPLGYKLYVEDGILTEKVKVATYGTTQWADYVFAENYDLNSIEEVAEYIKSNQHLPNVPSTEEVNKNGVDMVEMDATLLRQIEELWLHTIKLNDELKKMNKVLNELEQENAKLKKRN